MRNPPETAFDRKARIKAQAAPAFSLAETVAASHDVAGYVSEIVAQLETMAMGAKLDLLAYFLRMAQLEARSTLRGPPTPSSKKKAPDTALDGYKVGDG